MELKDAIDVLGMVEAHDPITRRAKDKAIRSMESWKEVIQEIETKCQVHAKKCAECPFCEYEFEIRDLLRIILKHLEEL